jgi:carbon-monoxide dehydrogenase iron sulfur subunit
VYHASSGKVVKCDLCEGLEEGPYCVASCPTSAIELVEVAAR